MNLTLNIDWDLSPIKLISRAAWCAVPASLGHLLFKNISYQQAALIGGGSVLAAYALCAFANIFCVRSDGNGYVDYSDKIKDDQESLKQNWSWMVLIPLIAIPHYSGVSLIQGAALVALGTLGALLKASTVGF